MVRSEVVPGQRYGRWTLIKEVAPHNDNRFVLVRCDCGKIKEVNLKSLRRGESMSCGCYRREYIAHKNYKHGLTIRTDKKERLYTIWSNMKRRCYNPNDKGYHNYGARGITICDEWLNDYVAFREWSLAHGYDDTLTIDRIDNDKGYAPANCRWTTMMEQSNNTRVNHLITYNGETHTIAEWSRITGISDDKIGRRIRKGLPLERVFFYGNLRYYKEEDIVNA